MDSPTTIYKFSELTSIAKGLVKGKGRYVSFYLRVRNDTSPTLVAVYLQRVKGLPPIETEINHAL